MSSNINLAATFGAAFAGSLFAFLFENIRERYATKQRNAVTINRALYTVFNLWNVLAQYQREVINPKRESPHAWLDMAASFMSSHGIVAFQADELAFLLDKHADIYAELLLEEQRFDVAIRIIEERSKLIFKDALNNS